MYEIGIGYDLNFHYFVLGWYSKWKGTQLTYMSYELNPLLEYVKPKFYLVVCL